MHSSQVKLAEVAPALAEAPDSAYQYQLSHDIEAKRAKSKTKHASCYVKICSLWRNHPILCLCGLGSLLGGALSCFLLKEVSPTSMTVFAPVSNALPTYLQEDAKTLVALDAESKLSKDAELEQAFSTNKMLATLRRRRATVPATVQNQSQQLVKKKATVQLIATTAIVQGNYEKRKEQYVQGLKLLNDMRKKSDKNLYILESCEQSPTFLEEYCPMDGCTVFYTQTNDPKLSNYGINLAKSLLAGLKHFDFSPDDMIIVFNGRYTPTNNEFVQFVDKNLTADVIAKIWNERDAYTALFAMKSKYLLNFLEKHIDPISMEKERIPFEYCFGEFITKIRQQGARIIDLDIPQLYKLPVVANRDYIGRFFQVDR